MGLVVETDSPVSCQSNTIKTMKTITFTSNYAAFTYRMTAEVGEDLTPATEALCLEGVSNLCYRVAGSAVDKALGVKSKKNGGMGRDGITFDAKHIPTIEAAVSAKITEMENAEGSKLKALGLSFAVTGEYVKGEGGTTSKEAEALWVQVQKLASTQDHEGVISHPFAKAMAKLGFKVLEGDLGEAPIVEDYDDDSGIAACQRHIQAEKRAAAERARGALGLE